MPTNFTSIAFPGIGVSLAVLMRKTAIVNQTADFEGVAFLWHLPKTDTTIATKDAPSLGELVQFAPSAWRVPGKLN